MLATHDTQSRRCLLLSATWQHTKPYFESGSRSLHILKVSLPLPRPLALLLPLLLPLPLVLPLVLVLVPMLVLMLMLLLPLPLVLMLAPPEPPMPRFAFLNTQHLPQPQPCQASGPSHSVSRAPRTSGLSLPGAHTAHGGDVSRPTLIA